MLKSKRGASMIWVLCLMCVVLIIGGSILTAGAISSGVAMRYREAKICYNYATTLADVLIDDIKSALPSAIDDPWRTVAQSVYDVKIGDSTNNAVLKDVELNVDFSTPNLDNAPVTVMNVKLTNQIVNVVEQYSYTIIDPPDSVDGEEPGAPSEIIVPEVATVQFVMIVELRTSIGEQTNVVFLKFTFNGSTLGTNDGPGTGQITTGTFKYVGAFNSAP